MNDLMIMSSVVFTALIL